MPYDCYQYIKYIQTRLYDGLAQITPEDEWEDPVEAERRYFHADDPFYRGREWVTAALHPEDRGPGLPLKRHRPS